MQILLMSTRTKVSKKIVVFANQHIKKGDEITYDYIFPVEDGSGAANCIGRMN